LIRADERITPSRRSGLVPIIEGAIEDLDTMIAEVADADEGRVQWLIFQIRFTAPTSERLLAKSKTLAEVATALIRAGATQPDVSRFVLEALTNAITPTSSSYFITLRTPIRDPQKFMEAYSRLFSRLGFLYAVRQFSDLANSIMSSLDYVAASISADGRHIMQRPTVVKASMLHARKLLVMAHGMAQVMDAMTKNREHETQAEQATMQHNPD
jgi:hypothetical protein